MKVLKIIAKILNYVAPVVYIASGVIVFVLCSSATGTEQVDATILGVILLVTGLSKIFTYFASQKYREKDISLFLSIITVALSFVFFFSSMEISTLLLLWGLLDILNGALEIQHCIFEIREKKMAVINLILAILDIVFGVLLCIHLGEGVKAHLIFLGIDMIVSALYLIADIVLENIKERKAKQHE